MKSVKVKLLNHKLRLCWGNSRRIARDRDGKPFDRGGFDPERTIKAGQAARAVTRNLNT